MNSPQKVALLLLRLGLGWFFFYSGLSKFLNPEFTAAGFLEGAKSMQPIYEWFSSSTNIGWVNFLNIWGQMAIGAGLMAGLLVRPASFFGILLMLLYYFPGLEFPYIEHGFLVDSHILYIFAFLVLYTFRAGEVWGLDLKILGKKDTK
ncbi:DoxX family membrane protein [Candidatus Peregrinibacteria bacterium]|nr:DoxX family membrane protein [Candidatus Peregrinibacteria bacterium]